MQQRQQLCTWKGSVSSCSNPTFPPPPRVTPRHRLAPAPSIASPSLHPSPYPALLCTDFCCTVVPYHLSASQVQRAIKRQRSLAAGELPPFGADQQLHHLQHQPLQHQPSGSLDFLPKCTEVLHRVYAACNSIAPMFGWSAKDVFYRPVRETFPQIANDYYQRIQQPMTFRDIEQRIAKGYYVNAQMFADVSGA